MSVLNINLFSLLRQVPVTPFARRLDSAIFKGIRISGYENPTPSLICTSSDREDIAESEFSEIFSGKSKDCNLLARLVAIPRILDSGSAGGSY